MANFCEHCTGQRFDRAHVLRTLRQMRRDLRRNGRQVDEALALAVKTIAALEIPHLDVEPEGSDVVH